MCETCANNSFDVAKDNFRRDIELKFGGEQIGPYRGNNERVECRCSKGHLCRPRPSCIQQGKGICVTCAGHDSDTARDNFRHNIEVIFGGKQIGLYEYNKLPVECICPKGHQCWPKPTNVQQGQGMCKKCCQVGYSLIAIKWLTRVANEEKIVIQHAQNGGEFRIPSTKLMVTARKLTRFMNFMGVHSTVVLNARKKTILTLLMIKPVNNFTPKPLTEKNLSDLKDSLL